MRVQANLLFQNRFNISYLSNEYENIITDTSASGIDKMNKQNFDKIKNKQLEIITKKVLSGNYRFTYYKEKLLVKKRDSFPRMISIPTLRDRIVLKILHNILQDTFEIKVPLVQTVISSVKDSMAGFDSYIKVDITNFYGSINHEILYKKIKSKVRKKEIHTLIKAAITNSTVGENHSKSNSVKLNDKGVPQGIPIANILAEIYLKDFDKKYANNSNIAYFRYVDDILILCPSSENKQIKDSIKLDIERNYDLEVNTEKTKCGLLKDSYSFLGYLLTKDDTSNLISCTVKSDSMQKFEKSIVSIFSRYINSNGKMSPKEFAFYLNLKITGSIVKNEGSLGKNKKYGWLFFYSQIDNMKLLYHLDFFVEKFIAKYQMEKALKDIEIKSFVKAYYEITQRRSKSKYIFKPDELSISEKIHLLNDTFSIPLNKLYSDEVIEKYFNKKVRRKIKELEEDIQSIS
ncbi:reverse transcriptase domain-containing protein [Lysinibacillus sp. NPDC048646]|uniref:reverse transcriptase domain-containing protein n=1 Tax=Lysinibacillus sp. NPDC048646 TaxID=3390574 RepID=UPI003CFC4D30